MGIRIEIAGLPVEIICHHPENEGFFQDYLTDKEPVFILEPNEEDLIAMREQLLRTQKVEGWDFPITDKFVENNVIHALLAENLAKCGRLLMHGSALCMDGEAYLFIASSGTGKSTHTRLWREVFGDRVWMVNDDKPMLQIEEDRVLVYGTPWNGKHHLGTNASAPLKAIILLTRGEENRIVPLPKADALIALMQHGYSSKNTQAMQEILKLKQKLIDTVSFYKLACNMDPDAAITAWRGMNPEADMRV